MLCCINSVIHYYPIYNYSICVIILCKFFHNWLYEVHVFMLLVDMAFSITGVCNLCLRNIPFYHLRKYTSPSSNIILIWKGGGVGRSHHPLRSRLPRRYDSIGGCIILILPGCGLAEAFSGLLHQWNVYWSIACYRQLALNAPIPMVIDRLIFVLHFISVLWCLHIQQWPFLWNLTKRSGHTHIADFTNV